MPLAVIRRVKFCSYSEHFTETAHDIIGTKNTRYILVFLLLARFKYDFSHFPVHKIS